MIDNHIILLSLRCVLTSPAAVTVIGSPLDVADLRVMGAEVTDVLDLDMFNIAHIMGNHFKAGEWPKRRCGSVITCVIEGRSLYARVERFFKIHGHATPGYASVIWFGYPEYPFDAPVIVKVSEEQPRDLVDRIGNVIRITQIDPSQVMVERDPDCEGVCWMMRDSGFDTVPRS